MNPDFLILALAAASPAPNGQAPGGGPSSMILMFGLMAVAFYLIIMRPQKREQQRRQAMLDNVKKGDKVVTVGGLHGWVVESEKGGRTVQIRVDTKTIVKVERTAISRIESGETEDQPAQEK